MSTGKTPEELACEQASILSKLIARTPGKWRDACTLIKQSPPGNDVIVGISTRKDNSRPIVDRICGWTKELRRLACGEHESQTVGLFLEVHARSALFLHAILHDPRFPRKSFGIEWPFELPGDYSDDLTKAQVMAIYLGDGASTCFRRGDEWIKVVDRAWKTLDKLAPQWAEKKEEDRTLALVEYVVNSVEIADAAIRCYLSSVKSLSVSFESTQDRSKRYNPRVVFHRPPPDPYKQRAAESLWILAEGLHFIGMQQEASVVETHFKELTESTRTLASMEGEEKKKTTELKKIKLVARYLKELPERIRSNHEVQTNESSGAEAPMIIGADKASLAQVTSSTQQKPADSRAASKGKRRIRREGLRGLTKKQIYAAELKYSGWTLKAIAKELGIRSEGAVSTLLARHQLALERIGRTSGKSVRPDRHYDEHPREE